VIIVAEIKKDNKTIIIRCKVDNLKKIKYKKQLTIKRIKYNLNTIALLI